MALRKMVHMARTRAEKQEKLDEMTAPPMPAVEAMPDYPPGLCVALDDEILDKAGISDEVEVGDVLHMNIMLQATHVSKHADSGGKRTRVEAVITHMGVEDEDHEDEEED